MIRIMIRTQRLSTSDPDMARAAAMLADGRLVAFPTESVYGLGGAAHNESAVRMIFAAKHRSVTNPLIVHVQNTAAALKLGTFTNDDHRLAAAFWPGPLTLVVRHTPRAGLPAAVTAASGMVGLRCPSHPVAQNLLARLGQPVAAPSANHSGHVSPSTADHVLDDLDGVIDGVIDGGPSNHGIESTIVQCSAGGLRILRHGAVTREMIMAALGIAATDGDGRGPQVPGQEASHYAPRTSVCLNCRPATGADPDGVWLGFGAGDEGADLNLSAQGDLEEAARNLYGMLRELDRQAVASGLERICISPIPADGVGVAINDRLQRAASCP